MINNFITVKGTAKETKTSIERGQVSNFILAPMHDAATAYECIIRLTVSTEQEKKDDNVCSGRFDFNVKLGVLAGNINKESFVINSVDNGTTYTIIVDNTNHTIFCGLVNESKDYGILCYGCEAIIEQLKAEAEFYMNFVKNKIKLLENNKR